MIASVLTPVPEVIVGLVQPVFPRWVENIQIDGVFFGPGFVRHVGRNAQHFSSADQNFLAVDGEFEGAFENVSYLFVVMMMQRDVRALLHQHAGEHDFVAYNHFAVDQRIQFFALNVFPRDDISIPRCSFFISVNFGGVVMQIHVRELESF